MLSIKKKIRSVSMDTKIGRTLVTTTLGSEGAALVDVLKLAHAAENPHEEAKQQKKNLLKILLKIHLMVTEGQIVLSQHDTLMNSIYSLYRELIQKLDECEDQEKVEIEHIATLFRRVFDDGKQIVSPFMTSKNVKKLKTLGDIFGNQEFLNKFFNDPKYRSLLDRTRMLLYSLGQRLQLSEVLNQWDMNKRCQVPVCDRLRVVPAGNFAGSQFCPIHHSVYIESEIETPSMTRWLNNDSRRVIFSEYLKESGMENAVEICRDTEMLQQIRNPKVRMQRLSLVYFSHLKPDKDRKKRSAHSFEVNNHLAAPGDVTNDEIENKQKDLLHKMASMFHEKFIHTGHYSTWVESVTLPDYIKQQMDEELKNAGLTLDCFRDPSAASSQPTAEEIKSRETGQAITSHEVKEDIKITPETEIKDTEKEKEKEKEEKVENAVPTLLHATSFQDEFTAQELLNDSDDEEKVSPLVTEVSDV